MPGKNENIRGGERGTTIVVVLFIATAIAALAAISSGRVVSETKQQTALEQETRALNHAYEQIQLALNVINTSAYDNENQNLELKEAAEGLYGGTAGGDPVAQEVWMRDPSGILHGKVRSTDVRVYHGRDYIKRIAQLKGEALVDVDPGHESQSYFVLEAAGRSGGVTRLVSALVRQNEPFSSFVFFQNRHPLGVSGSPRGLIHANDRIQFYFPNGNYVDSVSSVNGFEYEGGATEANTNLADANPEAEPINLEAVDFEDLRAKANLFQGQPGLDAEIQFFADGRVRIREFTAPYFQDVEHSWTGDVLVGYETRLVTETQQVQVGTTTEERTRTVIVGYETEVYTVEVPIYEEQVVERTRQVPIYETQTVTCTRMVQVFVPYDDSPDGGTAVGGDGGVPGEYVWVEEEYECEEEVIVGYETEVYTTTEQVQVGTTTEERTREVPIYGTETYTVEVPVYEEQEVEVEKSFPIYEEQTYTWTEQELVPPSLVQESYVDLKLDSGTIYIDGRITRMAGDLNGRVSVVGNEKVRITGDIRYVDDSGETAMLNGGDYTQPYERNPDYTGSSVLGVMARDDVLLTQDMPNAAEINATLMSALGRVGIDGFQIDDGTGDPIKDPYYGLTAEERQREEAYDQTSYRSSSFSKDSLRRLGGIISNDRILETYIRPRSDGTSYVDSGFKRGNMRFDFNLLFNPPPNFVEVPRPVVTSIAPIYFVRNED